MSVYFMTAKVSKTRYTLTGALIATFAGLEEIYELIVADPGNYLKYYIGYVEFLELKRGVR